MIDKIDKKFPSMRKVLLKKFIVNINPNIVTVAALFAAILAAFCFYYNILLIAAFFVLLNGFLDILDGEIAKKYSQTALGDFLDHTFDRLADTIILVGIALNPEIPMLIGFALVIVTLLVSYLGTAAQALTKKRLYAGLIGRSDRIVIISIIAILATFFKGALFYGIVILLVLSIITFIQRFVIIYKSLK